MSKTSLLALGIFVLNTLLAGGLLWAARPRTVATMDAGVLQAEELAVLHKLLVAEGVSPHQVRVCALRPCTRGPAVFVRDGRVHRLELARLSRPGPLAEVD
jgi:hypothetical protein